MANKFASNFAIPSSSNAMQVLWKLTRVMKAAGWNTVSHSDGTTKTAAGTNNNDSWGTNADPLADTYPTFDAAAPWIVMEGPQTLKIPLSANVSGTPIRGEKVTQTATSFEGEYLGHIWDGYNNSGYLVVMPRVNTPNNATNIDGYTSSAHFTPTGTIVTYKRQVMFSKTAAGTNTSGVIYYVCADASGESASLFSSLATQTGATATVPPGCGGTNNSLPTIGVVVRGTASSTTGAAWFGNQTTYGLTSQIACANATPSAGISADGSFWCGLSGSGLNAISGIMFTRVDDQEPGDVDPYVFVTETGSTFASWVRTTSTGTNSSANLWSISNLSGGSGPCFLGYHARGIGVFSPARDLVAPYAGNTLASGAGPGGTYLQTIGTVGTLRTLCNPATTTPLVRELVVAICPGSAPNSIRQIKGRCRWLAYFSIGTALDTYDSKSWFCVTTVTTSSPAIAVGPYDGTTTPIA